MSIQEGNIVLLQFNVISENGELIDSTDENHPFEYIHGYGDLHPELEKHLENQNIGDEFKVTLPPDKMYGHWDEKNIIYVKKDIFPNENDIIIDSWISVKVKGKDQPAKIIQADGDVVALDLNHPLAGESITYELKILDVKETEKLP